jgi:allophanate hydrolase
MADTTHTVTSWSIDAARALTLDAGAHAVVEQLLERRSGPPFPEAWISVPSEAELRARADEVDALLARGIALPFAGVPFAVKDNIDVAHVATTAGCPEYAYVPAVHAPVVERLLAAGAIYAGKTNLDQFATGLVGTRSPHFGACRNPVAPEFIAGGSSAGSAIVVSTGEVAFSLGTDTAGSGRVPAALCGVVGLKPTVGLVSTVGVVPAMASFDCVSVFAGDADDAAAVLDVVRDAAPGASRAAAGNPPRLGVPSDIDWSGDDDARACFDAVIAHAVDAGCSVVEVDGSVLRAAGALLYGSALVAERHAAFGAFARTHPQAMDPAVLEIVTRAGEHDTDAVFDALDELRALRRRAEAIWETVDALLTPTVARVPTVEETERDPFGPSIELGRLTAYVNPLGFAALAVPAGMRTSGVPFGVSVVGPGGSDDALVSIAAAFSDARSLESAVESNQERVLASRPCRLAVVGAHLTGQPLNHQLTDLGAVLVATTTTAPEYRLFALDSTPPKPGLLRAPGGGRPIEVEVWALDHAGLGAFVAAVPAPLGVGRVTLADGSEVTGFLCEPYALDGAPEITHLGGWRAHLATTSI